MKKDSKDPVKVRMLWIGGGDKKSRSISIPIDLHYWWMRRYRADAGPQSMRYLRMIAGEGVIECYPLRDWKKPSGDLNEFIVSVTATGKRKEYGKFAFPRRVMNYLYSIKPDLKEIRIIMRDGWFICEPA
jgi:hypothetical protein